MKVRRFYRQSTAHLQPGETLREAAVKMRAGGFSCLPVIVNGSVVAILSERDMIEAMSKGQRPGEAYVADYMSDGSIAVSPEDDIAVALVKMLAIGSRHLPVIEGGRLLGIVSARDLFLSAVRQEAAV
jgi:CBS domain-containing protein